LSVLECSDNLTISHNATSYTTRLYFNDSTAVGFHSVFHVAYSLPITYAWYVNGKRVDQVSNYLEYYFTGGTYIVTSEASYHIPRCEPCRRNKSVTVEGTWM